MLLNAAAKQAPASGGAAEKADQPVLDSIDTAVVFSKRVSRYFMCKSVLGVGGVTCCCIDLI